MQNMQSVTDHLKTHHTKWPATYEELVAECNALSDFSEADKKEFMEKLPKGTYKNPEEVLAALGTMGDGQMSGGKM